jgi:hypothetical protein
MSVGLGRQDIRALLDDLSNWRREVREQNCSSSVVLL